MRHRLRVACALLLLLAACAEREAPPAAAANPAVAPAATRTSGADYAAALAAPGRPAADREQDSGRKPAESLAFFGGLHVEGWRGEIVSRLAR